jgi:hypothetical protein
VRVEKKALNLAFSCLWLPIVCGKNRQANEIPAMIQFIVFKNEYVNIKIILFQMISIYRLTH